MAGWTIRQPDPGDAQSLAALHTSVWKHAYRGLIEQPLLDRLDAAASLPRWQATIASLDAAPPDRRLLIAVSGEEPVGIIEVAAARDDDPPAPTELVSLNVAPRWHGEGVAQALVAEALDAAAAAYLWVLRGNERAIGFYRKVGFHLDGIQRHDDVWRCVDLRMHRPKPGG